MPTLLPGQLEARRVVVNLTNRALTIGIGDDEVVSWDRAGRLYAVWENGRTCRRGLSGHGLEKWHDEAGRHRRPMDAGAVDRLVDHAADRARAVAVLLENGTVLPVPADGIDGLQRVIARAARFDAAAAQGDAQRFMAIYGEIGVLPPDQYLAFFAQATEGCTFGTCTFCDQYRLPFRVKTATEFASHLASVRAFLGDSLLLRGRSVFLGAANALALPTTRLLPMLDAVAETFDDRPPAVCGFIDGFTGARKTVSDYRALCERGLRRVYVGLESGSDRLLAFVGKPATSGEAIRTVHTIKAAGLGVAVIVMLGLGGDRFAEEHAAATAATLNRMALDSDDLVYFSDLVDGRGGGRETPGAEESARTLSADERRVQRRRISEGLMSAAGPPRTAVYDLCEFVY